MPRLTKPQMEKIIDTFAMVATGWNSASGHAELSQAATELRKVLPKGARIDSITAKPFRASLSAGGLTYYLYLNRGKPQLAYQP